MSSLRTSAVAITTFALSALPAIAGCAAIPQLLAPGASQPAPSSSTKTEDAPTAAQVAAKSSPPVASKPKEKAKLALGGDQFMVDLPCAPSPDKLDKDSSEFGPMTFQMYTCDDDDSGNTFNVLAMRFERALPASAKDSDRDAKSTAVAKIAGNNACDAYKDKKTTCKVGAPMVVGGLASVNVYVKGGDAPTVVRIEARYPYAAMVSVFGDGADDQMRKAFASLELPAR
jgi:hypothetical protein